jgi:ribonuclease T
MAEDISMTVQKTPTINKRFRGFLPIIVDIETGGLDPDKAAILEIAAVSIRMDEQGVLHPDQLYPYHVEPFEGGGLDPKSLEINKIDPHHPFRFAEDEKTVLNDLFDKVKAELSAKECQRAILVGHNAWFDLLFLKAACKRQGFEKSPFHAFSSFDTATLGGLAFGQTVLARATKAAGIEFKQGEAHSAIYDAKKTAELFCYIVNKCKVARP